MDAAELEQIFLIGKESRSIEFKESVPWNDKLFKVKITKTILAMSNIRDGGNIIFGVKEGDDCEYTPVGMNEDDFNTYNIDEVSSFVSSYADPYVKLDLFKLEYDSKRFVVLKIFEFEEIPVICKKDYSSANFNLRKGALYVRPFRTVESVEVPSQNEMREILDLATEKNLKKFFQISKSVGILPEEKTKDHDLDRSKFEKQIEKI